MACSHGGGVNDDKRKLEFKSVQELIEECGDGPEWMWHGFLARGWLTNLSGPAKFSGKTTLIAHMVRCLLDGRPFLDYPTEKTNVVYLTEQASSVVEPFKKAGLDKRSDGLKILQWKDSRDRSWQELVEEVFLEADETGAGVVVVDTLNRFAGLKGEDENFAGPVSDVMAELMEAAQRYDVGVLSVRHANREGKARGSTQFDHDVDVLLDLQPYGGNGNENARVLSGIGRSDDIPAKVILELRNDGYRNLGDDAIKFKAAVRVLAKGVSKDPENPTFKDGIDALLKEGEVSEATGRRVLSWLCQQGSVVRMGEGEKGSPYGYYAPTIDASAIPEEKGA